MHKKKAALIVLEVFKIIAPEGFELLQEEDGSIDLKNVVKWIRDARKANIDVDSFDSWMIDALNRKQVANMENVKMKEQNPPQRIGSAHGLSL